MSGADTIAAIATAPGAAGIAVVRVSGPEAFAIGERLSGRRIEPGRFRFVRLRTPTGDQVIDEAVMLGFAGPDSYTGEDVLELQGHGGAVTPRRVLEACLKAGARLARRGEFTERAFLNGKLDYDQAESVLNLIEAKTERSADAALAGLGGRRSRELRKFYEAALAISSDLEHALDVDESELGENYFAERQAAIIDFRAQLHRALKQARTGRILRQGARVVLAGPPNVGKSSLMNALLQENRAIVSATPGTTRDTIEEWLDLEGWPIRLIDTAGLRSAADAIEAEGVRRAEALIDRAELILRLTDGEIPEATAANAIVVRTKCDLDEVPKPLPPSVVAVSAKTGMGLPRLRSRIVAELERLSETATDAPEADVSRLAEVVSDLEGVETETDPVLLGNRIRQVAMRLGNMIGAEYSADLLDRLFSRFCVGK